MPTERRQINVRLDPETEAIIPRLLDQESKSRGVQVSMSELIRFSLEALRREHLAKRKASHAR